MKYRKKPIVVEAFQMTKLRRWDNSEWPNWLHKAWNREDGEGCLWIDPDDPESERLVLGTLEGAHRVDWDDWIIQGIKDELYPCKPDIFGATCKQVPVNVSEDCQEMLPGQVVYGRGQFGITRCVVADDPTITPGLAVECGILGHQIDLCFKDKDNWAEKYPVGTAEAKLKDERNRLFEVVAHASKLHDDGADASDWNALGESASTTIKGILG